MKINNNYQDLIYLIVVSDPCNNDNGGCSHLCLLSSTDSRGYSCLCPEEMTLDEGGLVCTHGKVYIDIIIVR